jgi:hypothetical protein
LVAGAASAITSGTRDSAVRTTVVRTNARRGLRAVRDSTTASTRPTIEKTAVSTPKPETGIGAPLTSRLTPAARPPAATIMVAALAAAVAATPVPARARVREPAVRVRCTVVLVIVASGGIRTGSVPVSHQGYESRRPRSTGPPRNLGTFSATCAGPVPRSRRKS